MKSDLKFFKNSKILPVDIFLSNVLYDNKYGYYKTKIPFGSKGDFITSPKISNLFSEIIAIWIISVWELFGKPRIFNIVELGPGDGVLMKILIQSFKRFPEFNSCKKIFLYEESNYLKKIQKNNISKKDVKWTKDFKDVKNGPVVFFGNEFFDAIPIKQFKKIKGVIFEKNYKIDKNYMIKEIFKKASNNDVKTIKSYKSIKNLKFIEFPKLGLRELKKISNKICQLNGCLLIIDYGYLKSKNLNTLQSVLSHKKNNYLRNLGMADITAHVNFELLKEFFSKNHLRVKQTISQKKFLENMGILERANIIAKKMKFSEQTNLYLRLKRLLNPKFMGELFKVILAYKFNHDNFKGFN